MADIVERLRLDAEPTEGDMEEAATEIERLRAMVAALEDAVTEWGNAVFLAEGVSFLDGLKCEPLIREILERPRTARGEDK